MSSICRKTANAAFYMSGGNVLMVLMMRLKGNIAKTEETV